MSEWLAYILATTLASGQIETKDGLDTPIVIEWKRSDILSPVLAEFKRNVADLASEELAPIELQFLKAFPEAASQELFLTCCQALLEKGVETVDWKVAQEMIQATIKQFYLMDLSTFGAEIIKPLMNDVYFFATVKNKETGHLDGFFLCAVTPALPFAHVKVVNLLARASESQRGLEKHMLDAIFALIPQTKRIFLFVRPTHKKALQTYKALGFHENLHAGQDPNHKINTTYLIPLEYEPFQSNQSHEAQSKTLNVSHFK